MEETELTDAQMSDLPVDTVDRLIERLPQYFTMCLASVVFFVALVGPCSAAAITAAVAACFGAPGALYFYYPDVADH